MEKIKYILLMLSVVIISLVCCCSIQVVNADNSVNNPFDNSDVLTDLRSSETFSFLNYPVDTTGLIKQPEVINFVEYGFSILGNEQHLYGLYLYFYNPKQLNIDTESLSNKVQIAVAYNENGAPTGYHKFNLKFCSMSTESENDKLFYKFKIIDNSNMIRNRVVESGRRYDISGIELHTVGQANANEYKVGGTYIFTGFAQGVSRSIISTLECSARSLETITLDLSGTTDNIDKRTYWRSNSSSLGAHHQNQINSVFFAIDKNILSKYGYALQKIKAEWWEYKTVPVIVLDNLEIYNDLSEYSGVKITKEYNALRGYRMFNSDFSSSYSGTFSMLEYDWSWNCNLETNAFSSVTSHYVDTLLPMFFYTGGINVSDYILSADVLEDYVTNYDKRSYKPIFNVNGRVMSGDLFADNVDTGRTKGYNLREFNIDNPNDLWNIRSYDSSHNWWQKFIDYGFGRIITSDDYLNISPIHMVTNNDVSVSDISNHLLINPTDTTRFVNYYNSVKDTCEVFIFRYAQTDYWAEDITVVDINGNTNYTDIGEVRQGTQFLDFDVIEFTFNKDGVYTVIPAVSSPLDHWSSYTPSIEAENFQWLKLLLMLVALVLFLILLAPFLPYILKVVIFIIFFPFNVIKSIFNAVSKRK